MRDFYDFIIRARENWAPGDSGLIGGFDHRNLLEYYGHPADWEPKDWMAFPVLRGNTLNMVTAPPAPLKDHADVIVRTGPAAPSRSSLPAWRSRRVWPEATYNASWGLLRPASGSVRGSRNSR